MNFQPDCPMERGGLAVCCVMERNSFSHGLRRASSLSEGASGEEVKRFGFAKGPISEGAVAEGDWGSLLCKWTNLSIYVISVKKPLAGLIFWPFSCKLKSNHAHAVSKAVNRHNSGTTGNNKL